MSDLTPFVEVMAKHLPPSAAALRLVDVAAQSGTVLTRLRGDLSVIVVPEDPDFWALEPEGADAIVVLNPRLTDDLLQGARSSLRPGGRLIMVDSDRVPSDALVRTLQEAGLTRILVEPALPDGRGVLMRGEKPHETADTLARIDSVAAIDDTLVDFSGYTGQYVYLLIRQTPNKPAWSLQPGEQVTWEAAAIGGYEGAVLLAFTGLPRAVAFMQPLVVSGQIKDVNKVAKFRRDVAQSWGRTAILNPPAGTVEGREILFVPVDLALAEASDE